MAESELSDRSHVDFRFRPGGRSSGSGFSHNLTKRLAIFPMFLFMLSKSNAVSLLLDVAGAPNDGFLPNALKRCFKLSGVLLKLCF